MAAGGKKFIVQFLRGRTMKHTRYAYLFALAMSAPGFASAANAGGFAPPPAAPELSNPAAGMGRKTDVTPAKPPAAPLQPAAPSLAPAQPLTGPIQLFSVKQKTPPQPEPPQVVWQQVMAACPNCGSGSTVAWNNYSYARAGLSQALTSCSSKKYTVQEQMAAGCMGSDTLNQCMEKLYAHCTAFAKTKFTKEVVHEIAAVRKLIQMAQAYEKHIEWMSDTYSK